MNEPATLLDVLNEFVADGYTESFWAVDGGLRCGSCRCITPANKINFVALRRLEGDSDPDDMQAVVALVCPACGIKGTAVLHYGPSASAEEADALAALEDRRPDGEAGVSPPAP